MSGTLFVVATPIGNLEDVTARALRVLREVAVIAAEDTRRTSHLLSRYAIATPTLSLHEHNELARVPAIIGRLQSGESVAVVSDAGTPVVSDPGQQLIAAAIEAGIRVEPIPGPSAVLAALMASGLPTETFTFLGFPPIRSSDRNSWFEDVRTAGRTVIFFEAPHRVLETLERLRRELGDCRVAVGREMTKSHEELVIGPISEVTGRLGTVAGEFTVVVDVGQTTNIAAPAPAGDDALLRELGELIEKTGSRKRQALAVLARRHGRTLNEVYAAVERAKKSGS